MWGSEEESGEEEESEKEEKEEEEEELDDLYSFMATQRQKREVESNSENEDENDQEEEEEMDDLLAFLGSQRQQKETETEEDEKLEDKDENNRAIDGICDTERHIEDGEAGEGKSHTSRSRFGAVESDFAVTDEQGTEGGENSLNLRLDSNICGDIGDDTDTLEKTHNLSLSSDKRAELVQDVHNSRLSSGALKELMNDWEGEETDKESVKVMSSPQESVTFDKDDRTEINVSAESVTFSKNGATTHSKSNTINKVAHKDHTNDTTQIPNHTSEPVNSPVVILSESDSDGDLDNSGSDLFNSLTSQKSTDAMENMSRTLQERVSKVPDNVTEKDGGSLDLHNDSSLSPSPVFATQKCRASEAVDSSNVSINLMASFDKASETLEHDRNDDVSVCEREREAKKRKRNPSSNPESSNVLTPKRPRQDIEQTKSRKEGPIPKRSREIDLSPESSREKDQSFEQPRQEDVSAQRQTLKKHRQAESTPEKGKEKRRRQEQISERPVKETTTNLKQEVTPTRHKEVSGQEQTQKRSRQEGLTPKQSRKDQTPTIRQEVTPPRHKQGITPKIASRNEVETSPVFHRAVEKVPMEALTESCPNANESAMLVDLTLDEDDGEIVKEKEGVVQSKELEGNKGKETVSADNNDENSPQMDISMNRSVTSPRIPSSNDFGDVFEGYEEPEAYHEDYTQFQQENVLGSDDELPNLEHRLSNVTSTESPRACSSYTKASSPTLSQENKFFSLTTPKADENLNRGKIGSKQKSREEKGPANQREKQATFSTNRKADENLKQHDMASKHKSRGDGGIARNETREADGVSNKSRREEDETASQKSRKIKKFHFKSQKASQSQKPTYNSSFKSSQIEVHLSEKHKSAVSHKVAVDMHDDMGFSSTQEREFSHQGGKNMGAPGRNDGNTQSTQELTEFSDWSGKSHGVISAIDDGKPCHSQQTVEISSGSGKSPEATFGSDDDDGILNMVMDEVEGTQADDFDPPTDISMNISNMEGGPGVHPNLLVSTF